MMKKAELTQKMNKIFDLGWKIGHYLAKNEPMSYEWLREQKKELFEERDQLIGEIHEEIHKEN